MRSALALRRPWFGKLVMTVMVALFVFAPMTGIPERGSAAEVQLRCNGRVASQLEAQVGEQQRRPPGDADIDKGFATLERSIADLSQEDEVLEATCGLGTKLDPLRADIRVAEAQAYLLEADLAMRKFARCPENRQKIAAQFVAAAWLELQRSEPDSGTLASSAAALEPAVRSRAESVGLTLLPLPQASSWWVRQQQEAAKQAAAACAG